ncbi:MAG: HEPN domain-containing protein [Lachnospiraceae bacterium]|nr:HEPN domain-containing protein [Lachnospiraceae bacterium]
MQDKEKTLSKYRRSLAEDTLKNAELCLDNKFFRDSVNRSYYAAFYVIKSLLALENVDFKRHKDAVGYFNKTYVATDKFPRELGKTLGRMKMVREESDYSDFYLVSEEDARKQFEAAKYIIKEVSEYIEKEYPDSSESQDSDR